MGVSMWPCAAPTEGKKESKKKEETKQNQQ